MRFQAVCARDCGKLLSKFQRDSRWQAGWLTMEEEHDSELHRWCRVARFHEQQSRGGREVFPPLYDATVIMINIDRWTITGFERLPGQVPDRLVAYQQSWILEPVVPGYNAPAAA